MTFIFRIFIIFTSAILSASTLANTQTEAAFSNASFSNVDQFSPSFNQQPSILPVEQAFVFDFSQQDDQLQLSWQIAPEHYLYQDKFTFTGKQAQIGAVNFPDAIAYQDEFFGAVQIYRDHVTITIPLAQVEAQGSLDIQYQGCAEAGFCYPPETLNVPLDEVTSSVTSNVTSAVVSDLQPPQTTLSQDGQFSQKLATNWWAPVLFLLLGVGLAFTPCVLPMYPILTSIVLGRNDLSTKQAGMLAFVYVQGMAITYTLLGLVVASLGVQFQAMMQHPYLLVGISLMFVALSLSMFGLYNLQLPSGIQTWLNERSQKQQGGRFGSVFIMGAISGLVCSPCVTAPLSGALLYVAQTGDLITGAITLYLLALGMGIPLILVAMFGQKLLPKAGGWMNQVKVFFGFVLLSAPIFLLERIISGSTTLILWGVLGLVSFFWLLHSSNQSDSKHWFKTLLQLVSMLGFLGSVLTIYQGYHGKKSIALTDLSAQSSQHTTTNKIEFIRIKTLDDLNQQLAIAKQQGKAVMFDYYADWCTACHEFEKYTFNDPTVANQLNQMVLLQADVTKADPQDVVLMAHLNVQGLPTIEFWNAQGQHQPQARIAGFRKAEVFAKHLASHRLVQTE